MRAIASSLLILSTALVIHFANGAAPSDRPAGVDPGHWIPVSDKMGFVMTTPVNSRPARDDGRTTSAARVARGRLFHGA
jgi:hypothetical protein